MLQRVPLQISNWRNRLINNQKMTGNLRIKLTEGIIFDRYLIENGKKQNDQAINSQKLTLVCSKVSLRVVTFNMRVSS